MTREEAKIFLPMLQAYAEGKTIEVRSKGSIPEEFNKWVDVMDLYFWPNCEYREKPGLKYRPFKSVEVCWAEMQKHKPFGWVKDKKENSYRLITAVFDADYPSVNVDPQKEDILHDMFYEYTFADGTPFGMIEQ